MVDYTTVILFAAAFMQCGAAYYAYRVMKISGRFFAWTLITAMLILMLIRRLAVFLAPYILMDDALIHLISSIITLFISACALVGMYSLLRICKDEYE
jgi:hypothetical protein